MVIRQTYQFTRIFPRTARQRPSIEFITRWLNWPHIDLRGCLMWRSCILPDFTKCLYKNFYRYAIVHRRDRIKYCDLKNRGVARSHVNNEAARQPFNTPVRRWRSADLLKLKSAMMHLGLKRGTPGRQDLIKYFAPTVYEKSRTIARESILSIYCIPGITPGHCSRTISTTGSWHINGKLELVSSSHAHAG